MKTIALITVHRTLNYGTLLQTYACNSVFRKENAKMLLIDYYRNKDLQEKDLSGIYEYYKYRKSQGCIKGIKSSSICLLKTILSYTDTRQFWKHCCAFLNETVEMTRSYYSVDELMADPPDADVFCSGSDQIWNSDYNGKIDEAYLLSFVPCGKNKISLASSIGKDCIDNDEKKVMKTFISQYSSVSVRENQAAEILNEIGISAMSIVDPTLLIDSKKWDEIADIRMIKTPYLLIYKLKGDNTLDEVAYRIAREKGLKIVRITFSKLVRKKGETTVCLPSVPGFLSLIQNAEYIVTNSFHGVCFSINFGRQFTAVSREKYNSRINNILKCLGLSDRLYTGLDNRSADGNIDYREVMKKLSNEREKAYQWIRQSINTDIDERNE